MSMKMTEDIREILIDFAVETTGYKPSYIVQTYSGPFDHATTQLAELVRKARISELEWVLGQARRGVHLDDIKDRLHTLKSKDKKDV